MPESSRLVCTDCSRYAVQNDGDRFEHDPPHCRSNGTSGYALAFAAVGDGQVADPYAGSPLEATTCALHRNPYRKSMYAVGVTPALVTDVRPYVIFDSRTPRA